MTRTERPLRIASMLSVIGGVLSGNDAFFLLAMVALGCAAYIEGKIS